MWRLRQRGPPGSWRFFLAAMPTERRSAPSATQPLAAARQRRPQRPDPAMATDATVVGSTFADLGVPAPLVAVLAQAGITAPFPIQAATLPDALAGRDILGRAQTGSGKTLGFCLPPAPRLARGHTMACLPRCLTLVPTPELT